MARTPIIISKEALEQAIAFAENGQALPTRTAVFEKACSWLLSEYNIKCSTAFLYLKCKEYSVSMLTPPGKRGRQAGHTLTEEQKQARIVTKKESKKVLLNSEVSKASFDLMEEHVLSVFPKETSTVAKIKTGSLRAMVRANCLLCSGDGKQSVADCNARRCVFWAIRPFQHKRTMLTVGATDSEEIVVDECTVAEEIEEEAVIS